MDLQLVNSTKKIKLSAAVFGCEFNEPLIHQAVTAFLAGGRAGTQAQKTRSEVRGGGIKPWRQKGTGRARAGTIRSPLWRKGGVIFAAKPRSYKQKMNKKAYRVAICSIMSELNRQNRFAAIETLTLETPKTKAFLEILNGFFKEGSTKDVKDQRILIVTDTLDANLILAARNLPYVEIREPLAIDPAVLVNADKVLVTKNALKSIEEWLE
jgi:large subunit ribosomal protein L4